MKNSHTRKIVIMSLLIAMNIILMRFLAIQTFEFRISFGFIPLAIMGMLYGPIFAGIGAAVADFLGVVLFPPPGGGFFPGFTLTAFLMGVVYGLFLHKSPVKLWHVCASATIVTVVLQFGINTFWLYIIMDTGVIALLPTRAIQMLLMTPVQIAGIAFVTNERFKNIFNKYKI